MAGRSWPGRDVTSNVWAAPTAKNAKAFSLIECRGQGESRSAKLLKPSETAQGGYHVWQWQAKTFTFARSRSNPWASSDLKTKHICTITMRWPKSFKLFTKQCPRLEVGNRQRKLHVHVVAHQLPTVIHHARPEKEFEGGLMDIASYVTKCPVPGDNLSAGIFLEAQRLARTQGHSRLPATAFKRGIPNN
jgi:hypothetical protein